MGKLAIVENGVVVNVLAFEGDPADLAQRPGREYRKISKNEIIGKGFRKEGGVFVDRRPEPEPDPYVNPVVPDPSP